MRISRLVHRNTFAGRRYAATAWAISQSASRYSVTRLSTLETAGKEGELPIILHCTQNTTLPIILHCTQYTTLPIILHCTQYTTLPEPRPPTPPHARSLSRG